MSKTPSDKEKTNHVRLSRLLADIGRRVLHDVLDRLHSPSTLDAFLNSGSVYSQLISLKSRRVIHSEQWDKLYPPSGVTVSSENFDITLLFLLLRSVCGLPPPAKGWDAAPLATDLSMEADLVRIKRCRNELYAHRVEMAMTDSEFNSSWLEIEATLLRLGGTKYKPDIQDLLTASMDPEKEKELRKDFQNLLSKAWDEIDNTVQWKDLINRVYIILAVIVIVIAVLYQCYSPGSWYRYRECSKGSIEGSEVWFTLKTEDKQTPRVHGVEFKWETLKRKLILQFDKHDDPDMRYYLNIDRCAYGGVVTVKSTLPWDRTPQVRGAEVFGVVKTVKKHDKDDEYSAYYESGNEWYIYRSGKNFKFKQPNN